MAVVSGGPRETSVNDESLSSHRPGAEETARFFSVAIRVFARVQQPRVLDFGCGNGALVDALGGQGYDVYGCDFSSVVQNSTSSRVRPIWLTPRYALPFQDEFFDVVLSSSVLEHAQDKRLCFSEIFRVLRPGGCTFHLFPAKRFLPIEPHIYVPLANWLWPHCPTWWFALWAILGVRNDAQSGFSWRAVAESNAQYFVSGLSYWTNSAIERLAVEVFGNCTWASRFLIDNGGGRFTRVMRRLPFRRFWALVYRECRYAFLLARKAP